MPLAIESTYSLGVFLAGTPPITAHPLWHLRGAPVHAWLLARRQAALQLEAVAEVALGFQAVLSIFSMGLGGALPALVYWQVGGRWCRSRPLEVVCWGMRPWHVRQVNVRCMHAWRPADAAPTEHTSFPLLSPTPLACCSNCASGSGCHPRGLTTCRCGTPSGSGCSLCWQLYPSCGATLIRPWPGSSSLGSRPAMAGERRETDGRRPWLAWPQRTPWECASL